MSSDLQSYPGRTILPKRIKPLSSLGFSRSEYEQNWNILNDSIEKIFHNQTLEIRYETLYKLVSGFNQDVSIEVFENLRKLCLKHVNQCAPGLFRDESTNDEFLSHINESWQGYCQKMQILRRIFIFVDRKYWMINPSVMSFWDMAMQLWRDMFITGPLINKIIVLNLKQVQNERLGDNSKLQLTKSIVAMLMQLELYYKYWEPRYMDEAKIFYAKESEMKLKEMPDVRYLTYVTKKMSEENERSEIYLLGDSIRIQFRDQLISIILKPQLDELLKIFFNDMMHQKDMTNLETLYNLTQLIHSRNNEVTGIGCLRNHFKEYVMKVGSQVVENPDENIEKDKNMTQDLLDLKDNLDIIVIKCFKSDVLFHRTIRECFESFVNARPNKPAEYLAKFLDSKLKSGNKNLTEEAMNTIMDKVMTLFRFITGKDVFEAFYLKDLAKRLLMGKSACVDTEKAMLEKLKHECGPNYTRKMEVMFSDIDNSQRLSKQFNESQFLTTVLNQIPKDSAFKGIEMNVHVICNATWPNLGGSKLLNLPQSLLELQDAFSKFYKTTHNGRKLRFEPYLGTCVVKAHFPLGKKELQVSEFQCMTLMQFNGNDKLSLTYTQLEENLKIEPEELKRTILSLSVGKGQKVLTKKPMTTILKDDDVFSFNEEFKHKLTKIKFNQIQTKETKEEQQATEEQVFIDRQSHLDCYIVRLMKSHRVIEHTQLVTEVLKDLRFPVKGSDIKKRIEHLIERDFITRDSTNSSLYHYVA